MELIDKHGVHVHVFFPSTNIYQIVTTQIFWN